MERVGLRERKRRMTRAAILDAAQGLFERQGFAATTLDDITDAAVVSRRTFFRYFEGKDDLVFADEDDLVAVLTAAIDAAPAGPALAAARSAALTLAEQLEERRDELVAHAALVASTPQLGLRAQAKNLRLRAAVAQRLRARSTPPHEAEVCAHLTVAVFDTAFDRWRDDPDRRLRAHVADQFDVLRRAVAGLPPLATPSPGPDPAADAAGPA